MREDAELLTLYAQDHSEEAFAELVRRHINFVYAAALRRVGGDAHLAEDVTQRVFTDLARKAAALAGRASLAGWLHRSTHYAAVDAVRREQRRRLREQKAYAMSEIDSSASAPEAEWNQLRPVLDTVLDELGDADREAVLLRYFEGRALAEVGVRLRVTEEAARKRVDRAVDKLRTLLGRRGITSTSAALSLALLHQPAVAAPVGLAATVTGTALSAAAATGGTVGLLELLALTKIKASTLGTVVVASTGLIGSATLSAIAWQQSGEIAAAQLASEHATAADRHRLDSLAARLAAVEQERDAARRALRDAEAARAKAPPSPRGLSSEERTQRLQEILRNSPEYAPFEAQRRRLFVQRRYGDLFAELKLAPAQLEQLKQLLIDSVAASETARNEAEHTGEEQEAMAARIKETREALMEKIRVLFGADVASQLHDYDTFVSRTKPVVDKLALDLDEAGIPLDETQRRTLIDVFRKIETQIQRSSGPDSVDPQTGLTALQQRQLAGAASVLQAAQSEKLRELFVEARHSSELRKRLLKAAERPGGRD